MTRFARKIVSDSLPIVEVPFAYGPWIGLAKSATKLGLETAHVPGAAAGVELVGALLGVQDAQTEMLSSIRRDTELLRRAPLKASQHMLASAKRVGRGHAKYAFYLEQSLLRCADAHSLASTVQERAVVELNMAVAHTALGDEQEARHWLGECHRSVCDAVDALARDPGLKQHDLLDMRPESRRSSAGERRLRPRSRILAKSPTLMAYAVTRMQRRADERRIASLNDFLTFVNAVEAIAASRNTGPFPRPLRIERDLDRTFGFDYRLTAC